ncbi:MAG: hypothetical protein K6A73_10230 [Bacteroidales bacterium]|nr:hypothetical protein [Bacteroidales bacterium]
MNDVNLLKTAFRKLLTYTYFHKSDMVLRHNVALFAKSLMDEKTEDVIFGRILSVTNGENEELFNEWLEKIRLVFMPKHVNPIKSKNATDKSVITNIPPERVSIDRLLIMVDIPVELLIIDVAWVLLFGCKLDGRLSENSWGNRLDLVAGGGKVREGNALFKKYHTQYRRWWQTGVDEANAQLKKGKNISIINFDIENYYHSVNLSFDYLLSEYDKLWPNDRIKEDKLTSVIQSIYSKYWELTKASDEAALCGRNEGKHALPLGLMSARILANWNLSPLDNHIVEKYKPLYYGRYVDDCMLVVETKSNSDNCIESINQELPDLFDWRDGVAGFKFAAPEVLPKDSDRLQGLTLQSEKLYIYRFDCELPQASLEKFEEDQIERSSEFRFQTDEADNNYGGLETITLVSALEAEEEKGRRFDILEENKYKLSVYLAKLCTRLAKYGDKYEHFEEVEKVARYFRGGLLIKHYLLWERLMTVFVLAGKKELVEDFAKNVRKQIRKLDIGDNVFEKEKSAGRTRVQECLLHHLNESKLMALSLNKQDSRIDKLYLDTFMVRMHYNTYPMQEFAETFKKYGVRVQAKDLKYSQKRLMYRWLPYFVHLYDVVGMFCIGKIYNPDLYEKAFQLYMLLNGLGNHGGFVNAIMRRPKGDIVSEFNTNLSMDFDDEDKLTVGVVNMDIKNEDEKYLIDNYGTQDAKKSLSMLRILDQITNIPSVRMFILPELSLPEYELKNYCRYSANSEKAFVAGMEYVVKSGVVYNYIVTCLPVVLYGQKDALPVIRLKNYYAPKEIENIEGKGYKVPSNKKVYQNLYHWHGHVFTTYYCYELTSIKDRSFFFGKVDAVYCPVYNKDTYYFNNIAESLVRDMHCYFILSNVSHYGDSRVTKPASHVEMNLMKVKGGNTDDNNEITLSAVLDIKGLREFQKQPVNDKFKKTPPGYSADLVKARERKRFLFDPKNKLEGFLTDLTVACMEYMPVWN